MTSKEIIREFLSLVSKNEITIQELISENAIDFKVMEKHMIISDFKKEYHKIGAIRAYDKLAEKYCCSEGKIRFLVSKRVAYI